MATGLRPGSRIRQGARPAGAATRQGGRDRADRAGHARFAQRSSSLRRRARRVWTWLGVVLVLVSVVVLTLWWSLAFVVEEVAVTGAQGEVAAGAQERADVPLGIPLARVDTDAVAGRVEQDPRVAKADVARDWPSAVTIGVSLREPALVIDQAGAARLQVADATGVIFDRVAERPADLMLVRASRGDLRGESLTGVLDVLAALPPETARRISSVRLTADGDLRFHLGPVQVSWGAPGQDDLKAGVLAALIAQPQIDIEGEQQVGVDLSTPRTPVVTGLTPDDDT